MARLARCPSWSGWSAVLATVGGFVLSIACGAPVPAAGMSAVVMLLALVIEHRAGRAAGSARMQVAVRAARVEGERDAAARVIALEMSYERSRSVLEALREGVIVADGDGVIVLANPAARRALQGQELDPTGRPLWDALTTELGQRAREAWQALNHPRRSEQELPQIRYSGIPCRDAVYDLTAVEARSMRTGQDFGSVFLLVDATRAHELQRLKDSFLSSVSHELRTPLTNICAYAELLAGMESRASQEWPEFVRIIHEQGLQLSRLIDGMFDFLQLESGEAVFTNEPIDGEVVVREALTSARAMAEKRHIELTAELDASAPMLLVDRCRLRQVVRHLLENAIKFTPIGGRIRATMGPRDDGWELRIEDSGPGVPPHDRSNVFEKFHQLCDPLTDKSSGTGLGLATSRAIVARFGGLIWCEDSPLGGATFVVMLPGLGQPRLATVAAGTGAGGGF